LAPRPLRRFIATMDALTAGRLSAADQLSLIHARDLPTIPPPTTRCRPRPALTRYPSADGLPVFRVWASPFVRRLATATGRIAFVILRTGRSSPAASHPASRRRGCIRLRAGERLPGRDFHPSSRACFQAHECGGLPAEWRLESAEDAGETPAFPGRLRLRHRRTVRNTGWPSSQVFTRPTPLKRSLAFSESR
jgi:hypothetical protein